MFMVHSNTIFLVSILFLVNRTFSSTFTCSQLSQSGQAASLLTYEISAVKGEHGRGVACILMSKQRDRLHLYLEEEDEMGGTTVAASDTMKTPHHAAIGFANGSPTFGFTGSLFAIKSRTSRHQINNNSQTAPITNVTFRLTLDPTSQMAFFTIQRPGGDAKMITWHPRQKVNTWKMHVDIPDECPPTTARFSRAWIKDPVVNEPGHRAGVVCFIDASSEKTPSSATTAHYFAIGWRKADDSQLGHPRKFIDFGSIRQVQANQFRNVYRGHSYGISFNAQGRDSLKNRHFSAVASANGLILYGDLQEVWKFEKAPSKNHNSPSNCIEEDFPIIALPEVQAQLDVSQLPGLQILTIGRNGFIKRSPCNSDTASRDTHPNGRDVYPDTYGNRGASANKYYAYGNNLNQNDLYNTVPNNPNYYNNQYHNQS